MIKKIMFIISLVVIVIGSILLYDRHKHIRYDNVFYENHVEIRDGLFFDAPNGRWLDLSDEMFMNWTNVFVDGYNYLLCTWDNTYNMYTHWAYTLEEGGQPYLLGVIEKDIYDRRTYANPVDYLYYGEVEGLKISYDYLTDYLYVKIESKTKTIELDIYKEHKEVLEKVVLKAIDVLKD